MIEENVVVSVESAHNGLVRVTTNSELRVMYGYGIEINYFVPESEAPRVGDRVIVTVEPKPSE